MNQNEDDDNEYEEEKGGNLARRLSNNGHKSHSNSSPKLHRMEPHSYFEAPKTRRKGDNENGTSRNLGEYRDTATFSDERPSQLGMIIAAES